MQRIVVISGVTGAIGSALLSEYAQSNENIIYGISRKALPLNKFLINDKLPQKTFICSLTDLEEYKELFTSINYENIDEVVYIHALGYYPFEVNKEGTIVIGDDQDNDGINDITTKLSYSAFTEAVTSLSKSWKGKTKCVIFGGIADKHEPAVHQSWWKTIKKVKEWSKHQVEQIPNLSITVFNISSVICPHEIITRPYVFIHTDAEQTKWLHPYELAKFVVEKTEEDTPGFRELDKYRIKEGFNPDEYYQDPVFTPRKVKELY